MLNSNEKQGTEAWLDEEGVTVKHCQYHYWCWSCAKHSPRSPSPPFTCHEDRWSSAQLAVPASRQGLMVMSPSSPKKKKKPVNHFSVLCLSPPPQPIYFWKHAGADWAMISCRELCFPLNIISPRLIYISQAKVKEYIHLCFVFC